MGVLAVFGVPDASTYIYNGQVGKLKGSLGIGCVK